MHGDACRQLRIGNAGNRSLLILMSNIVRKLWKFSHTLRHDGTDYGDDDEPGSNTEQGVINA